MRIRLEDTVGDMFSDNFSSRFRAEYWQTKIRYDKLHRMIVAYEADTLDFKPNCDLETLTKQAKAMGEYLHILEIRAEKEGISLGNGIGDM